VGVALKGGLVQAGSMIASTLLPNQLFGRWAEFALGMVAAEFYVSGRLSKWIRPFKSWMLVVFAIMTVLLVKAGVLGTVVSMVKELLFGASTSNLNLHSMMLGTVYFVLVSLVLAGKNAVSRLFSWSPLVKIGTMSYSLYLIHEPIVNAVEYQARRYPPQQRFILLVGAVPLIFLAAWCLFMLVERRTLTAPRSDMHRWPSGHFGSELLHRARHTIRHS